MLRYTTLAFVILLASCANEGERNWESAEAAIGENMKDPFSMQFRDVKFDGVSYCGYVNAKNSWGAYAGFNRFYVTGDFAVVEDGDEDYGWAFVGSFDECFNDPASMAVEVG
jgi:hypothetical protein